MSDFAQDIVFAMAIITSADCIIIEIIYIYIVLYIYI